MAVSAIFSVQNNLRPSSVSLPILAESGAEASPYTQYVYGYPHKTAYRALSAPIALSDLWKPEDQRALSLYVHVPFCEMRCGFCNLFTTTNSDHTLEDRYLDAVERQARATRAALSSAHFANVALGGGTPTWLSPKQLERVFAMLETMFSIANVPIGVETSPQTATADRLTVLKDHKTTRVSIGVQSFFDDESKAIGRPQSRAVVEAALERLRAAAFETLNIDLIYGIPGQTTHTWLASIRAALKYQPEELYLYPLYVRPLTGMAKTAREWDDERQVRYREGRDLLLSEGYTQRSMRMFERNGSKRPDSTYACQRDAMVGLGCGARSYTTSVHYSEEWAVASKSVRDILQSYIARGESDFSSARYGFVLDTHEQLRRHALLLLLTQEGLDECAFYQRFHSSLETAIDSIAPMMTEQLIERRGQHLVLTERGLALSDLVGPRLFSPNVLQLMSEFSLR